MPNESTQHGNGWKVAGAAAVASALLAIVHWYRRPLPPPLLGNGEQAKDSWLYFYLPEAEFAGEVSVNIHASASAIFNALQRVTLDDMPLARWIGTVRYLPGKLGGATGSKMEPDHVEVGEPFLTTLQVESGNIILADEPGRELVIGAIGKFHNLFDQQMVPLATAQEFLLFNDPHYQKLAMGFRVNPLADHTGYRVTLTHRTHALSQVARWKFTFYWLGIKHGGNFVSWLMLRAIKSLAEEAIATVAVQESRSS
jgi:hypothetical protein